MSAWCNICLLDSRQHGTLQLVLDDVRRIRAAFDGSVVIFMLTFIGHHAQLWAQVIQRAFRDVPNVDHYLMPEGQYILCFGQSGAGVTIRHAKCIEAPPDVGVTKHTDPMLYLELTFQLGPVVGGKNVAVLWVPGLFGTNGYQLNGSAYRGALGLIKATAALHRAATLSPEFQIDQDLGVEKACRIVQEHLSAFILIVNERSAHFDGASPLLNWHMSGDMHAVCGTVRDGRFEDFMESVKLCTWPACFRVKAMEKPYLVPHHCLKFWEPLFEDESESRSEPSAAHDGAAQSRVKPPRTGTSGNDAGLTSDPAESTLHDPECMICLSRPPTFVFQSCGHLGVCGPCRKWMCKHEYNRGKTSRRVAPGEVTMDKAGSVRVRCPLCMMRPTRVVYKGEFRGKTYNV